MIRKGRIPLLAAGHGINDLLAGYFLGSMAQSGQDLLKIGLGLFMYNLLAFGGQYPAALWIEKQRNTKPFLLGAFALNLAAASLFSFAPAAAILFAGIASAIYHVAGGSICASEKKAAGIGLFAAPGVAGLIAGGYFAWSGFQLTGILVLVSFLFLVLLRLMDIPERTAMTDSGTQPASPGPDRHDLIMILLLTVIALRSAVWNIFQLIHENNYSWLIPIAAAAFAGKIAGGWLADRFGWRLYTFISLAAATPLVSFFRNELLLFCIGVGLLQSGIPATTAMLIQATKGKTERGIGLSFGTAIIIGGITFTLPPGLFSQHLWLPVLLISAVLLLLLIAVRKDHHHITGGLNN